PVLCRALRGRGRGDRAYPADDGAVYGVPRGGLPLPPAGERAAPPLLERDRGRRVRNSPRTHRGGEDKRAATLCASTRLHRDRTLRGGPSSGRAGRRPRDPTVSLNAMTVPRQPQQRERALSAIVELVARDGYVDSPVAKI